MKGYLQRLLLLLTVVLLTNTVINAQTVSGTIFDDSGNPLSGVSVLNKKTNAGTASGIDGTYKIAASLGDSLIYTSVGYKRNGIKVASFTQNIVLASEVGTLSDVVVVGYGTQRKEMLLFLLTK